MVPESSCVASGSWGRQEPGLSASPRPLAGSALVPAAAARTPWTTAAPGWGRGSHQMKEASDQDGPGLPAFTQATFPPCMGARLQCIRCTLDSTAWGTPTVPGGFHSRQQMALSTSKTHISHNALVKIDPTLYWKCPPPFLIQVKHGIRCLSNTPRSHTSLQCTGQLCLPPVPLPNLPMMHLEI